MRDSLLLTQEQKINYAIELTAMIFSHIYRKNVWEKTVSTWKSRKEQIEELVDKN
jgi:hypothetical protein